MDGPVYNVESKHHFKHGFVKEMDKKTVKGPVYDVEHNHKFEKGFSCKHRPPSPTPGPVRGEFKSHFKHPITLPRGRDGRSKSVGYEVDTSDDFKEKDTRSSDLKTMVGPIYSSGKIADERIHHFTDGYVAPLTREKREEQVKLVTKYFQREKKVTDRLQDKIVAKAEKLQKQYEVRSHSETRADTRVTREEALRQGESRRQEALQRRQQFLQQESEQTMKKTTVGMSQKEKMKFQQERFFSQQEEARLEQEDMATQQQQIQTGQFQSIQQSSTQQHEQSYSQQSTTSVQQQQTTSVVQQPVIQASTKVQQQAARMITETAKRAQRIYKISNAKRQILIIS